MGNAHAVFYCYMLNVESTEKALHNLHEDNAFELNLVPTNNNKTLFERVYANTAQINRNKCGFKQITYALNNKLCKLLCKFKSNYNIINHINIHFSQIIKLMKKQNTCLVVPQLLSKQYFAEVNCLAYQKNNA